MARGFGNVLDRRAAVGVALALTIAAGTFASAAIFSVRQRASETQRICNAVRGLRNDLVSVVTDGDQRSKRALIDAFSGKQRERLLLNLKDQTAATIAKINNPDCP